MSIGRNDKVDFVEESDPVGDSNGKTYDNNDDEAEARFALLRRKTLSDDGVSPSVRRKTSVARAARQWNESYRLQFYKLDVKKNGALPRSKVEDGVRERGYSLLPSVHNLIDRHWEAARNDAQDSQWKIQCELFFTLLHYVHLCEALRETVEVASTDEVQSSEEYARMFGAERRTSAWGSMMAPREEFQISQLFDDIGPIGKLSVRLVRIRNINVEKAPFKPFAWAKHLFGGSRKKSKKSKPKRTSKSAAPSAESHNSTDKAETLAARALQRLSSRSSLTSAKPSSQRRGNGYYKLLEETEGDETFEHFEQFEVGISLIGLEGGTPIQRMMRSGIFELQAPLEVMFARHVEFTDVRASSSTSGIASVALDFRLRRTVLSEEKHAKRDSLKAKEIPGAEVTKLFKGRKDEEGDLSREKVPDEKIERMQVRFGTCYVFLDEALRLYRHRTERLTRHRRRRERRAAAQLRAKQLRTRRRSQSLEEDNFDVSDDDSSSSDEDPSEDFLRRGTSFAAEQRDARKRKREQEDRLAKSSPWDALKWYPIFNADQKIVAEAYIGVKFEAVALNQEQGTKYSRRDTINGQDFSNLGVLSPLSELTAVERLLFTMYDVDEDGLLSPPEFATLLHDMRQVHGDVDAIAGRTSNPGCLGRLIALPDTDLLSFVQQNHTLAGLIVAHPTGPGADHWTVGLGGVEMNRWGMMGVVFLTMLYSFSINAAVEIGFWKISSESFKNSPVEPPLKVFTKMFVDVLGCYFLKELLLMSNMKCFVPWLRLLLNLSIASFLLGVLAFVLTHYMTSEQVSSVTSTFMAVWFLARVTEIFHLGTLWAFKVSYGSSLGCNCC